MTAPDEALRALALAATPGPWEACVYDSGLSYRELNVNVITVAMGDHVAAVDYDGNAEGPHAAEGADAYFIAAANPTAVLALLDERDALRAQVERVRALAEQYDGKHYLLGWRHVVTVAIVDADLRAALDGPQ